MEEKSRYHLIKILVNAVHIARESTAAPGFIKSVGIFSSWQAIAYPAWLTYGGGGGDILGINKLHIITENNVIEWHHFM